MDTAETDRREAQPPAQALRRAAVFVTTSIKLGGLAIAIDQGLLRPHPVPVALALAAFMMAGAQLSEGTLLAVIDHLFRPSMPVEPEPAKKPGRR